MITHVKSIQSQEEVGDINATCEISAADVKVPDKKNPDILRN